MSNPTLRPSQCVLKMDSVFFSGLLPECQKGNKTSWNCTCAPENISG